MVSFRFSLLCSAAVLAFSTSTGAAAAAAFAVEPSFEPFDSPEPSMPPFVTAIPIPTAEPIEFTPTPFDEPLFESPVPTQLPDFPDLDVTPIPTYSPVATHDKPHPSPDHAGCSYTKPSERPPVCFFEKRKCCYKFKPCGFKVKKVKSCIPITHKVCEHKKVKKCYNVPRKVLTKECKYKKIEIPCKHSDYDQHDHGYKKCEPTYETKKVCCDKWVIKYDKICKHITVKQCKLVKAKQIVFKFFKYAQYCAKLECGQYYKHGNYKKPEDYTAKDGKLIRTIKGKKITHDAPSYKY